MLLSFLAVSSTSWLIRLTSASGASCACAAAVNNRLPTVNDSARYFFKIFIRILTILVVVRGHASDALYIGPETAISGVGSNRRSQSFLNRQSSFVGRLGLGRFIRLIPCAIIVRVAANLAFAALCI